MQINLGSELASPLASATKFSWVAWNPDSTLYEWSINTVTYILPCVVLHFDLFPCSE